MGKYTKLMMGMKLPGGARVERVDVPVPTPGPGQVLLKMKAGSSSERPTEGLTA